MAILESKRLRLRRFKLSDLQNMRELESDPDIMKFTPSRIPLSVEKSEQRLRDLIRKEESWAPFGVWAVEFKENSDFAGWFMLLKTDHEAPELGFMIVKRHWGKGIATEAAICLIDFGFNNLNLTSIVATTNQDNVFSKKVLNKLSFNFLKTISVPDKVLQHDIALDVFELRK